MRSGRGGGAPKREEELRKKRATEVEGATTERKRLVSLRGIVPEPRLLGQPRTTFLTRGTAGPERHK
jgi:hypothetical protein